MGETDRWPLSCSPAPARLHPQHPPPPFDWSTASAVPPTGSAPPTWELPLWTLAFCLSWRPYPSTADLSWRTKGRGVFLAEGRSLRGRPQGSPTPRHRQGQGCAQCQGSVLGLEPERLKAALWREVCGPGKLGRRPAERKAGSQLSWVMWGQMGQFQTVLELGPCSAAV